MTIPKTKLTDQRRKVEARMEAIRGFLESFAPSENQDLLAEMVVTVCRLARDGCGRGELKILNSALKELRYAFKIFEPYSDIRKVTIFGSARTAEQEPAYQAAAKFASHLSQKNWMVITGAKISSRLTLISGVVLPRTVGRNIVPSH